MSDIFDKNYVNTSDEILKSTASAGSTDRTATGYMLYGQNAVPLPNATAPVFIGGFIVAPDYHGAGETIDADRFSFDIPGVVVFWKGTKQVALRHLDRVERITAR